MNQLSQKNTKFNFSPIIKKPPKEIYKTKYQALNNINNEKSSLGSNNWVLSGRKTKIKSLFYLMIHI